jgi:hypothetical protein
MSMNARAAGMPSPARISTRALRTGAVEHGVRTPGIGRDRAPGNPNSADEGHRPPDGEGTMSVAAEDRAPSSPGHDLVAGYHRTEPSRPAQGRQRPDGSGRALWLVAEDSDRLGSQSPWVGRPQTAGPRPAKPPPNVESWSLRARPVVRSRRSPPPAYVSIPCVRRPRPPPERRCMQSDDSRPRARQAISSQGSSPLVRDALGTV